MYRTEEEMKKTWCPEYRAAVGDNRGNNEGNFLAHSFCLGSKCSQWRWLYVAENPVSSRRLMRTDKGYCGKGGRPHAYIREEVI